MVQKLYKLKKMKGFVQKRRLNANPIFHSKFKLHDLSYLAKQTPCLVIHNFQKVLNLKFYIKKR